MGRLAHNREEGKMDYFEEGFCIREPSWHRKETLVMRDLILPQDRPEAEVLAGHDFTLVEVPNGNVGRVVDAATYEGNLARVNGVWRTLDVRPEKKGLYINQIRDGEPGPLHGNYLEVVNESLKTLDNSVGWDVLEAIVGEGAKLDTGMALHGGAVCLVTAKLDEPTTITGDDSFTIPYIVARWTHNGTGALSARHVAVRVVCANTDELSREESRRTGREFTFRHTKNVMDRINDAKAALAGVRLNHEEYVELAEELAATPISKEQRDAFVNMLLPMPPEALVSDRVAKNVDEARAAVQGIFAGPTIPVAHKFTAYGLRLAGVEYLDHIRGYRTNDTYVGRQLLRTEPAKVKLSKLIREVVAA
jgi:phage/plasmid-like protein (TIGR03299 family)